MNLNDQAFSPTKTYQQKSVEGFVEIYEEMNYYRLHYLRFAETTLIRSMFGYKYANLISASNTSELRPTNYAETAICKENATDFLSCKIIKFK